MKFKSAEADWNTSFVPQACQWPQLPVEDAAEVVSTGV